MNREQVEAFMDDQCSVPFVRMHGLNEEVCPLSMAAVEPKVCKRECIVCPPLMLWSIATGGVTVGGTVGTYTDY